MLPRHRAPSHIASAHDGLSTLTHISTCASKADLGLYIAGCEREVAKQWAAAHATFADHVNTLLAKPKVSKPEVDRLGMDIRKATQIGKFIDKKLPPVFTFLTDLAHLHFLVSSTAKLSPGEIKDADLV